MEGESLFDRCWAVRGTEDFLIDLVDRPEIARFILERMAGFFLEYTRLILRASAGTVDAIGLYNDLGTQNAMFISPTLYREFIKPHQARLIAEIHAAGARVFYHACGCVEAVYPDLIEIGVDILDPLQPRALKVTPEHLKQAYGGRVTLHGGLDAQGFLQAATPEQVRAEVRHLVETFGAGGGYILSGSHFYQADIPPANLAAIHAAL